MCRLLETILILDGLPQNIALHEERLNHSRRELLGRSDHIILSDHIIVPPSYSKGIVRCRLIYGPEEFSTEFSEYTPAVVKTLIKVIDNTIIYDHKYIDRNRLMSHIDKNIADDILLIKNNFVTDSSYANIVFCDGDEWFTPDTPLLRGTMREKLLRQGVIREKRITANDIGAFSHFRLINAMLGFDFPPQPVSNIL